MSNALAIAATTATLQAILSKAIGGDPDLSDTAYTMLPPDKARTGHTTNQLNLFLYQILPNAAWRNWNAPTQVKPGESGMPPLAINLHYLLTVYGRDNDNSQPFDHHLLGRAMSTLHDHALLGPDEIRLAFPGSDLERQVERVRITLQPLTIEEISKLWTGFATQYRLSVGYEVSVALIDSTQPVRAPLPTLTRGAKDSGPAAQSNLVSPFPALVGVAPPNQQDGARLGDPLTISGFHLDGTGVGVLFDHPLWATPIERAPDPGGTATQLTVGIPNLPATWPAGMYTLGVLVQRPGESFRRATNLVPFPLAPAITIAPTSAAAGTITFTITVSPQVLPAQQVSLLVGDLDIPAAPIAAAASTLSFTATLAQGDYFVRLRVDGVDSLLIDHTVAPPVFDTTQKVTVT
jgi:hypothetical protein